MADYIRRDYALHNIECGPWDTETDRNRAIHYVRELTPAANVRPVVLCRDCVYYNTTGCADGFGWCEGVMVSKGTSDDFFCAEGKQNPYECGAEMERNLDTTKGDNHD